MSKIFSEYPYVDYENFNLDWILKKMKECIQRYQDNEESIDALQVELQDLRDYVNQYFASQDFETLIRQVLDEMEDDGTLAEIINTEIFNGLSLGKLDNARMTRAPFVTYGYVINNKRHNLGMNIHSGAICAIGRTQFIIGNNNARTADDLGIFRRVSIQTDTDEIASITSVKLGHANSMCVYNEGELLVAPQDTYASGSKVDLSRLYVINLSGVFLREIVTPEWIRAVSRDPITGTVYVVTGPCDIYTIDPETDVLTFFKNVPSSVYPVGSGNYNQDFAVYNGIAYINSPGGMIRAFRLDDLSILFDAVVGNYDAQGYTNIGEIDGIEFTEEGNLLALADICDSRLNYYVGFVGEIRIGVNPKIYSLNGYLQGTPRATYYGQMSDRIAQIDFTYSALGYPYGSRPAVYKDIDILPYIKPQFTEIQLLSAANYDNVTLPDYVTFLDVGHSGSNITITFNKLTFKSKNITFWIAGGSTLKINNPIAVYDGSKITLTGSGTIRSDSTIRLLSNISGALLSVAGATILANVRIPIESDGDSVPAAGGYMNVAGRNFIPLANIPTT